MNEEATVDYEQDESKKSTRGNGRDRGSERVSVDEDEMAFVPDDLREAMQRARLWVGNNPFAALGIAVATGFVVGRVFRGSK